MEKEVTQKRGATDYVFMVNRVFAGLLAIALFFPAFNAARVSNYIESKLALFTSAVSYSSLVSQAQLPIRLRSISSTLFVIDNIGALLLLIGIAAMIAAACMSLGNINLKRVSLYVTAGGTVLSIVGLDFIFEAFKMAYKAGENGEAIFPKAAAVYFIFVLIIAITNAYQFVALPGFDYEEGFEMDSKFKLFLMFLPFGILAFLFCYLPLWGWRYAFFDYQAGGNITMKNFVGMKWFIYLFKNAATRNDVINTMINTLAMSGLGLIFSWLPMAFAIFLCEIKNMKFRRFVQTVTTIPNFISWVLVYALALSIFDTDGFVNQVRVLLGNLKEVEDGPNYLMKTSFTWVKMWAWGTWKGIGWSAIIYIAGITGIDQQLYEAAEIDGAGRFQKMWNVTVPGLLPTFFVLLLMQVAAILSNGLDQYLVFENARNAKKVSVLDLYVYHLGLGDNGSIPLSTVVGMFKSVISVILLFGANAVSKALRGESIV